MSDEIHTEIVTPADFYAVSRDRPVLLPVPPEKTAEVTDGVPLVPLVVDIEANLHAAPSTYTYCDCSKKVKMTGVPGKDYRVISTTSPKGHQKWVLHNDPSCYAEVMANLQNAQS